MDESATLRDLGIFGANARHVVAALTGVQAPALTALAPYAHVTVEIDGVTLIVVKVPDLDVEGFELMVPAEAFTTLWTRAVAAGATPAGLEAWEIARVEAGRPEWGLDIDDNTIPQEANFDELHAISYTKGCYVGQETVARVHFRGHVNKHLRGIHAAGLDAPPTGATLHDETGQQVGDVRTAVRSPRLGGIALAMIRREVAPGASLLARWTRGDGGRRQWSGAWTSRPCPSTPAERADGARHRRDGARGHARRAAAPQGRLGCARARARRRARRIVESHRRRARDRRRTRADRLRARSARVRRRLPRRGRGDAARRVGGIPTAERRGDAQRDRRRGERQGAPGAREQRRRVRRGDRYSADGRRTDENGARRPDCRRRVLRALEARVRRARVRGATVGCALGHGGASLRHVRPLRPAVRASAGARAPARLRTGDRGGTDDAADRARGQRGRRDGARRGDDDAKWKAYNLANDYDVTVADFFRLAAEGMGTTIRILSFPLLGARIAMGAVRVIAPLVVGDRFNAVTSASLDFMSRDNPFTSERARRELGWDPPVRPEDGIPDAFRWWVTHH